MPLISQRTIDAILNTADLVQVISRYVDLKKAGSTLKGKSPFTDEKTGSFMVSKSKNIYKCFSSGTGGNNPVKFIMQKENLPFPEAVKVVGEICNIPIEYDENETPEAAKRRTEAIEQKTELGKIMEVAVMLFHRKLLETPKDHVAGVEVFFKRQLTEDEADLWKIGYAPGGRFLREVMAEKGMVKPGQELSLLGEKGDKFQERIVFPIQDEFGNYVGVAGRDIKNELDQDGKAKWPKFLNPSETKLYDKSRVLYGLNFAKHQMAKTGTAYLTEGYNDVIAMHRAGITNTVASCGTALADGQIKLLKRFAKNVVLLYDGDKAGVAAIVRALPLLLQQGLQVQVCILPEGEDPDSYIRGGNKIDQYLNQHTADAILALAQMKYELADTPYKKSEVIDEIIEWLFFIDSDFIREDYIQNLAKALKIAKKALLAQFKTRAESKVKAEPEDDGPSFRLPKGVDKDEVIKYGFYGLIEKHRTGYYFQTSSDGDFKAVSNFVITPLFHKSDEDDNTRIIKIDNGIMEPEIVELPSKALISVDQFRNFLFDRGPFFFDGTKQHLDKLNKRYLFEFPKAFELKTLGWQNEGFFAYYNTCFNGKLTPYNEVGIVKHEQQYFFSPASSDIYKNFRQEDDMYENDRYLEYIPTTLNFASWADLFYKVYDKHAYSGVIFVLIALFKDIVFKLDANVPFLYGSGPSQSGKSKWGESVQAVFFKGMPGFNLNSGTDFAFAAKMARFKNCAVLFNEFDDKAIKPEWFQAIKGAFDGEGRERGKGGSKNKTEIQRIHCALILLGQYLSTKDDNSVSSRSIIEEFVKSDDRSDAQVAHYNHLKEVEKDGLSGILPELLQHRSELQKEYTPTFNTIMKKLIEKCRRN
ncbi:MAG: DNA primase, partial [Pseudoalteromonas tetraodonis]